MISNPVIKFNHSSTQLPLNYQTEIPRISHTGPHLPPSQNYSFIKPNYPNIKLNQYQPSTSHQQLQQGNTLIPQLSSAISFGNNSHILPAQPIRISFNQHGYKPVTFQPQPYSQHYQLQQIQQYPAIGKNQPSKRPQLIENPSKLLRETRSSKSVKGEVKAFNVDTSDVKTIKQNEFIGCFHCFSPITYSTESGKMC